MFQNASKTPLLSLMLVIPLLWASQGMGAQKPGFRQFTTGGYETSCIVPLTDKRYLVLEDEEDFPITMVTMNPDHTLTAKEGDASGLVKVVGGLDDFEGCAIDEKERIYAITSHSRSSKGKAEFKREKLVRFSMQGDKFIEPKVFPYLKMVILEQFPFLQEAVDVEDVKNMGGFNIEGFALDRENHHLLIGLRSPVEKGKALILRLTNPNDVFDKNVDPVFAKEPVWLDLQEFGIRAMTYDTAKKGYWIISGPVAKRDDVPFQLWFWNGKNDAPAQHATIDSLDGVKRGEGITLSRDGKWLIIVSDDGNRLEKRFSHYLVVDKNLVKVH
ncbi:MAG: DUF3616 domain-containing protein [Magnetococcales bacterium]|nr:DUF3616 domain-containing protein [Magnetococcales bacterium]